MIKKVLLISIFLTIPAMALMTYIVYWARNYVQVNWGIEIGTVTYSAVLCVGFGLAIWLTAGGLLKELRVMAEQKQAEKQQKKGQKGPG